MRVILAGILGGIVIFFWGAIAHMATPLGMMGLNTVSKEAEPAILSAVKTGIPETGMYFLPARTMGEMNEAEQAEWEAKVKAGPTGLLIVQPGGAEPMSPRQLGTEFATNILAAFLGAILLTRISGNYLTRVACLGLVALMSCASLTISYWNWYAFPLPFIAAELIMDLVGWLAAGLVMAAIVKGPVVGGSSFIETGTKKIEGIDFIPAP